jgi:predicted  nucleic acid-binding Zn-ribbon protein
MCTASAVKNSRDSLNVRQKLESDTAKSNRASYDEEAKGHGSIEKENDRFVKDQKVVIKEAIKKQDENLLILGHAADRLHEVGKNIKDELDDQKGMIDGLEGEIDDASDRMNSVQAALTKLLKTKDGCQIWTIVILAVILILLGENLR